MDKDTLRYLADLAVVRGHINNILGISRGVLDQKKMHQISAKASILDKMFVDSLLSGDLQQASVVQQNNDDFVDITKRLQEEKAKIAAKLNTPETNLQPQNLQPQEEETEDFDDDLFKPPASEVAAFEELLAEAESSVEPTPKKKRGRPKKV